jgi:hypothetical protein
MVSDLKYYENLLKEWFVILGVPLNGIVIFLSNQSNFGIYVIGVMWCIMHVKGLHLFIDNGIFFVIFFVLIMPNVLKIRMCSTL